MSTITSTQTSTAVPVTETYVIQGLTKSGIDRMDRAMSESPFIRTIKNIRALTGFGLREAKAATDDIWLGRDVEFIVTVRPGTQEALNDLRSMGHKVDIVTDTFYSLEVCDAVETLDRATNPVILRVKNATVGVLDPIRLIKLLRTIYGCTLLQAKVAVDTLREGREILCPAPASSISLAALDAAIDTAAGNFGIERVKTAIGPVYSKTLTRKLFDFRTGALTGVEEEVGFFECVTARPTAPAEPSTSLTSSSGPTFAAATSPATKPKPRNNGLTDAARRKSSPAKVAGAVPFRRAGLARKVERTKAVALDSSKRGKTKTLTEQFWTDEALRAVEAVAKTQQSFTTDEVWTEMLKTGPIPNGCAPDMGAVIQHAMAKKYAHPSPLTRKTRRPSGHRRRITVWVSDIFQD